MSDKDLNMIVARNIQAAMERKGTNPSEVARRAKLNATGVYDILSGKSRNPRLDTIQKIAEQGLGVSVASLLVDEREAHLDQEIVDAIGAMPAELRRQVLSIARALARDLQAS